VSRCIHHFHVVWATQYRQELLTPELEKRLFPCILQAATDKSCDVLAVNGMPDHIHILIKTGAVVNMPDIMKTIKGRTSALINHIMEPEGHFRWQTGYCSISVSPSHVPKVVEYIHRQKEHHADGSTHALWEKTTDEEGE
jgi:putative transposase